MLFSQTIPDEHPPTPLASRWPALITLPHLAKFQLVWRRLCDIVMFVPPASSLSTPLRPSVYNASISLIVNMIYIRTFGDHIHVLYIFDHTRIVLKSDWSSTVGTLDH